jgi:hypothetical protein
MRMRMLVWGSGGRRAREGREVRYTPIIWLGYQPDAVQPPPTTRHPVCVFITRAGKLKKGARAMWFVLLLSLCLS